MLRPEFKYYHDNYRQLLKKYANKFVVIKGKKVLGAYDSHKEAYTETRKVEALGTFLIQQIVAGKEKEGRV